MTKTFCWKGLSIILTLAWFRSYLPDCYQFVYINEEISDQAQVRYGVQESAYFIAYASPREHYQETWNQFSWLCWQLFRKEVKMAPVFWSACRQLLPVCMLSCLSVFLLLSLWHYADALRTYDRSILLHIQNSLELQSTERLGPHPTFINSPVDCVRQLSCCIFHRKKGRRKLGNRAGVRVRIRGFVSPVCNHHLAGPLSTLQEAEASTWLVDHGTWDTPVISPFFQLGQRRLIALQLHQDCASKRRGELPEHSPIATLSTSTAFGLPCS